MLAFPCRPALRRFRRVLLRLDPPWRHLIVAALAGGLGALAVLAFKRTLFFLEFVFVGAHEGHLVAAARALNDTARLSAPCLGALAAGMLLWLAKRGQQAVPQRKSLARRSGDYIEAVAVGNGRLDLHEGLLKVTASLLVVSTGGSIGREGAMILLAAMLASMLGRVLGRGVDLRLIVSCGAAAGMATAYHAPLAGAVFVAEILLGSLSLSQFGPVVVATVTAYGVSISLGERSVLFPVAGVTVTGVAQVGALLLLGVIGGVLGAGLLRWLRLARSLFERTRLPPPLAFALGGLIVGVLSLWRPEVWGNGYSSIRAQLDDPAVWSLVAFVLGFKLLAIAATTGSGAPGGVFTPTLFVGAATGVLAAAGVGSLIGNVVFQPVYAVVGMAVLLAATTHAPVMSALMVFEMTGQYALLPVLLAASVVSTLLSRRLEPVSVYGLVRPRERERSRAPE